MIVMTPDQQDAVECILHWVVDDPNKQTFTLAGLAGTGKTTILRTVVDLLKSEHPELEVVVVAPTGKASHVLRTKGVPATTIHSFCYRMKGCDDDGKVQFDFLPHEVNHSNLLVIVDEASMVNSKIHADLIGTKCRLLFVGDHGQLAPIGGDPGIMEDPDCKLETIMRQGENSAIVQFAHHIRGGGTPEDFRHDEPAVQFAHKRDFTSIGCDIWLCASNLNRRWINTRLKTGGAEEQVVVLRNDYRADLMNGQIVTMVDIERGANGHPLTAGDQSKYGSHYQFYPDSWLAPSTPYVDYTDKRLVADYGYALTVHKSQGSEWDNVAVLADKDWGDDLARWQYTAITRARSRLIWVRV